MARVRVLLVEDNPADALLEQRALERAGYALDVTRCETLAEFRDALEHPWDLVITDHVLPGFTGSAVIELVRTHAPDTPTIVVSGVLGEEAAVAAMRAGAADFVVKGNLARLGNVVERALGEAAERRARRAAEQALAAQERSYRELFDAAAVALLRVDLRPLIAHLADHGPVPDNLDELRRALRSDEARLHRLIGMVTVRDANAAACELFEVDHVDELRGSLARSIRPGSLASLTEVLVQGVRAPSRLQQEVTLETLRGRRRQLVLTMALPRSGDRGEIVVSLLDVTDLRDLENQMRAAQRLESVARLAGGIAHDFNNLLTVIGSYTGFVRATLSADDQRDADLEAVEEATRRGTALIRQLLTFSRQAPIEAVADVVDVVRTVHELHRMIGRVLGEDIALDVRTGVPTATVQLSTTLLEQVLMNLVVNARDAMPRGGPLGVRVDLTELDARSASAVGAAPGHYVRIEVEDAGIGMDAATQARIFEPFFTTKALHVGTGLGLSTVYGIVRQAGGHIEVRSQVQVGTVMRVFLPYVPGALARTTAPLPVVEGGGAGTILLIEDDDLVRNATARMLTRGGYQLLLAGTGEDAVALARVHAGALSCVVTDVVMPGLHGDELVRQLRALLPQTPVLCVSGYPADFTEADGGALAFLAKPFASSDLLAKIRVLTGRERSAGAART
ncbi:MAG: response regulator [Deltaproteobacteria bacterium]|nr:response regulator [Deltaproteobacteria bacterium]